MGNKASVAILAGGFGTRLQGAFGDLPKPMVLVDGVPILEHQIKLCKKYGFKKIALLVCYGHETIENYFGDGANLGVHISYIKEEGPRGTGGALIDALDYLDEHFLVLYGDVFADIDLRIFFDNHLRHNADGTLVVHPNDHPEDSDLVEVDDFGKVRAIFGYPHNGDDRRNLVNAALFCLRGKALKDIKINREKFDFTKHILPLLIEQGLNIRGYITVEYLKDMGTPQRLAKVEGDIQNGLTEKLAMRSFRQAVFLDRDGTINKEVHHLNCPDKLVLLDGVSEAIRLLNRSGTLAIAVTNQPVVARGEVTLSGLNEIHARLDVLLGRGGAYLDRIYFCPHHPDAGFPGEVPSLKKNCNCRKPQTGLIDAAISDLNISRRKSWMIGDATSDILAGKRAGLRTILVSTGYAGADYKYQVCPDFVAENLLSAVRWIQFGYSSLVCKLTPIALQSMNARLILIGGVSRSGKSTAAKVIKDVLESFGKTVHYLPLDWWLKQRDQRMEGVGVINRYDLDNVVSQMQKIFSANKRVAIEHPIYSREVREIKSMDKISIGVSDIIILEGVPALLDSRLYDLADISINLDIDDASRIERIFSEYRLRGDSDSEISKKIISRDIDEVDLVRAEGSKANFQLNLDA